MERRDHNYYSITISPFKTNKEAREFIPKAVSFLYWLSLKHKLGLSLAQYIKDNSLSKNSLDDKSKLLLSKLRLAVNEGSVDPNNTIIINDISEINAYSDARALLTVGKGIDLIKDLEEVLRFSTPENVIYEKNLGLWL